jgi:hypothetical protein
MIFSRDNILNFIQGYVNAYLITCTNAELMHFTAAWINLRTYIDEKVSRATSLRDDAQLSLPIDLENKVS